MRVPECLNTVKRLDILHDDFMKYLDKNTDDENYAMLCEVCMVISDYKYYLEKCLGNTKIEF